MAWDLAEWLQVAIADNTSLLGPFRWSGNGSVYDLRTPRDVPIKTMPTGDAAMWEVKRLNQEFIDSFNSQQEVVE